MPPTEPAKAARRARRAVTWTLLAVTLVASLAMGLTLAKKQVRYFLALRDDQTCVGCHQDIHPELVRQWYESPHADYDVGCEACHGSDHEQMFRVQGQVPASACAVCHAEEAKAFAGSRHARAEGSMKAAVSFQHAPAVVQKAGCEACHDIGRVAPDGSVGRCDHCHGGHGFLKRDANQPEACGACHLGPDHPQLEAWAASRHGKAYRASGGDERVAPTCQTCHLAGPGRHADRMALTLGGGTLGTVLEGEPGATPVALTGDRRGKPVGVAQRVLSAKEARERREQAVTEVCRPCHSVNFARRSLDQADGMKRLSDKLMSEGAELVIDLYQKGALVPMPEDRPPLPHLGHALALGEQYAGVSALESSFFALARFHRSALFKGAYHFSPDHAHWIGYQGMHAELARMKAEARRLAAEKTGIVVSPSTP